MRENDIYEGARNLLVNCAGLKNNDKVIILHEDPNLGWYDLKLAQAVAQTAQQLGIQASLKQVSGPGSQPNPDLLKAWQTHDNIISFARIGDQDRFAQTTPSKKLIMSYVRDIQTLASKFATSDHRAFKDLKNAVNNLLLGSNRITVSCPMGTSLEGILSKQLSRAENDVSVLRFPLTVPQPVNAVDFSGKVALYGYLTSTGSKSYSPDVVKIEETVFAQIEQGRIKNFSGDASQVTQIQNHYQNIASQFNIDADVVHSWHAGIHPGCTYSSHIDTDPDQWSNSVFSNPKFLHFHTCGNYAPGEIAWMILDPTVELDGIALWNNGRLEVNNFKSTQQCLADWPELVELFDNPSDVVGL